VVLIAVIIALVANPEEETPAATSSSPTRSATSSTPTPTQTTPPPVQTVEVVEAEFANLTEAQAEDKLLGLGLRMESRLGEAAATSEQVGRAYAVSPTGPQQPNALIAVTFYGPVATAPQPSAPTATPTSALAGVPVTINWTRYPGCPAGMNLREYNFSVTNGTAVSGNPVSADATTMQVTTGTPGTMSVSYIAVCGDSLQSPSSGAATVTVTAAPTATNPPATP